MSTAEVMRLAHSYHGLEIIIKEIKNIKIMIEKITHTGISLLLLFVFISCNNSKELITIFGTSFQTNAEMMRQSHDSGFLKLNKLEALHYNLIPNLTDVEIAELSSIVLRTTNTTTTKDKVVNVFIFTTNQIASVLEVSIAETHAFSIFTDSDNGIRHQYFEKNNKNEFKKVPHLTITLGGGFSYDDIRMLHFANIGEKGLPKKTTIYEFSSNSSKHHYNFEEVDYGLREALLMDNRRYWGASTTGLYGEELQTALMADDQPGGGGGFCGFVNPGSSLESGPLDPNTGCPQGANPCYNDPIAGTKKYCTKKDKGGCFAATATLMKATAWTSDVGVDFIKIWNFQDEFLLKYDMGKGYMATSLFYALFVEPDKESLKMAEISLPLLYKAMDVLISRASEHEETIVVTPELYEAAMAYIKMGRSIKNRKLQVVLDSWERDLNHFLGLPKKEFVAYFKSNPPATFPTH